ncbi:hypothetical protein [Streptococcus sp. NLN76]|uniref:hypothetical protein n=1 Tax=Streptococcus sp. NLN76 TaxID=2822800 RepID=UPI0018ABD92B|nr:hypothetical protein [Streptococcus sp. NLN76]MBF8970153.1 hypothetical protein [Streptococcus sp. NLN76]
MDDKTLQFFAQDIAGKLTQAELESSEFKARYQAELGEKNELAEKLTHFEQVLESDQALKELFEEVENKMKEGN